MVYLFCTQSLSCSTHQCVSAGVKGREGEVEYQNGVVGLNNTDHKAAKQIARKNEA